MSIDRNAIGTGRTILPIENNGVLEFRTISYDARCIQTAPPREPSGGGGGGGGSQGIFINFTSVEEILAEFNILIGIIPPNPSFELRALAEGLLGFRQLTSRQFAAFKSAIRSIYNEYGLTLPAEFELAVF